MVVHSENQTKLDIESKILVIRGQHVMIDRDLAELYGVETKVLNQAVKRNIERFPERFMFQLTKEEQVGIEKFLRSQFVTIEIANEDLRGRHSKYLSYAFTEQGVAMLASVLKSDTAVLTSIMIIDAFVALRRFLQNNSKIFTEIDYRLLSLLKHLSHTAEIQFRRLQRRIYRDAIFIVEKVPCGG